MTTSPPQRNTSSAPSRWARLSQVDVFGWAVAVGLVGLLGWFGWGIISTNAGSLSLAQLSLPTREDDPGGAVAPDATMTPTATTAFTSTETPVPMPETTIPPTETPVAPTPANSQPTVTPRDTSTVPNGWAAGTVLYITEETGYHADIFNPPDDPTQLQRGDTVTVQLAPQRRGFFEWVEFEGERWWFVDGWGWLPEDVLSERPPR